MPPLVGLHFDELDHFVIYDYDVHWIDISRCWLDGDRPVEVRASDYRVPGQPDNARNPWGANVEIRYASGANVLIRTVGDARTARGGAPFWIHGTEGTIRGSVLLGSDFLELDRDGEVTPFELEGAWYPEGLAGTMAELLSRDRRGPRAVQLGPAQPALARADAGRLPLGRPRTARR